MFFAIGIRSCVFVFVDKYNKLSQETRIQWIYVWKCGRTSSETKIVVGTKL